MRALRCTPNARPASSNFLFLPRAMHFFLAPTHATRHVTNCVNDISITANFEEWKIKTISTNDISAEMAAPIKPKLFFYWRLFGWHKSNHTHTYTQFCPILTRVLLYYWKSKHTFHLKSLWSISQLCVRIISLTRSTHTFNAEYNVPKIETADHLYNCLSLTHMIYTRSHKRTQWETTNRLLSFTRRFISKFITQMIMQMEHFHIQ